MQLSPRRERVSHSFHPKPKLFLAIQSRKLFNPSYLQMVCSQSRVSKKLSFYIYFKLAANSKKQVVDKTARDLTTASGTSSAPTPD
jgi:hypothetical protein